MSISVSVLKTVMIIPAVVSGLWIVRADPHPHGIADLESAATLPSDPLAQPQVPVDPLVPPSVPSADAKPATPPVEAKKTARLSPKVKKEAGDQIINRRMRIEKILVTLDQVAQVTLQMGPEQSAWIEPVLVDLAEQTLGLTSDEAVSDRTTDEALDDLEGTVNKLVNAVSRMVEPEMSL